MDWGADKRFVTQAPVKNPVGTWGGCPPDGMIADTHYREALLQA